MTTRPKFDRYEYLLISVALAKFGGPKEVTETALSKLEINADLREPDGSRRMGRPQKKPNETVDVRRARVIESLMNDFPSDDIQRLIDLARTFSKFSKMIEDNSFSQELLNAFPVELRNELGKKQDLTSLFPENQDLRASVSRGRKKLRELEANLRKKQS